jgi:hypothetical protein
MLRQFEGRNIFGLRALQRHMFVGESPGGAPFDQGIGRTVHVGTITSHQIDNRIIIYNER